MDAVRSERKSLLCRAYNKIVTKISSPLSAVRTARARAASSSHAPILKKAKSGEDVVANAKAINFCNRAEKFLFEHPDAPSVKSLLKAGLKNRFPGNRLSGEVGTMLSEVALFLCPRVEVREALTLSRELQTDLLDVFQGQGGYTEPQARAMWDWMYSLASKGRAPHLFPGLKVTRTDEGDLIFRLDPSSETLRKSGRDLAAEIILWHEDYMQATAFQCAMSPAP